MENITINFTITDPIFGTITYDIGQADHEILTHAHGIIGKALDKCEVEAAAQL